MVGFTAERAPRRDVDDPAASRSDHVRYDGVYEVRRADEVGVDRAAPGVAPVVVARRQHGVGFVDARVVHQDVDPSELRDDAVDDGPGGVAVGQIGPHSDVRARA